MKTSAEYGLEKEPPPCPSVMVNNCFIVKKGMITYDQLAAALVKEG